MLNINFVKKNNEGQQNEFDTAIRHELAELNIQQTTNDIKSAEKQLRSVMDSDTLSEEERQKKIDVLNIKLDDLRSALTNFQKNSADTLDIYNKVFAAMTAKNADHFGNDKDVVRTVLRVLATWNNSKLVKYAIIPAFTAPDLYQALETIHVLSKAGDDGQLVMNQSVKDAYKKASNELERIIKTTFSLPFETEYTTKTRVKLTAEDKKLLHDCYVKGFTNKYDTNKIGVVSFTTRQINTLVKVKTKKDKATGEVKTTYDYSALAGTIANIVIKHYFA